MSRTHAPYRLVDSDGLYVLRCADENAYAIQGLRGPTVETAEIRMTHRQLVALALQLQAVLICPKCKARRDA